MHTPLPTTVEELQTEGFFGGGVYAKQTFIPKGMKLTQHVHLYDHLSLLATGSVEVCVDGVCHSYQAPCDPILILAGKAHEVTSLTDCIWYCLWAVDVATEALANAEAIDATLIA